MREIKFRVWYNGKLEHFDLHNITVPDRALMSGEHPVQQYTGLNDKNGVEIYEGDIVQYNQRSSYDGMNFIVKWSDHTYGWFLQSKTGEVLANEWTPNGNRFDSLEVVGNIYEQKT